VRNRVYANIEFFALFGKIQKIKEKINQSINQSKHVNIAPYVSQANQWG